MALTAHKVAECRDMLRTATCQLLLKHSREEWNPRTRSAFRISGRRPYQTRERSERNIAHRVTVEFSQRDFRQPLRHRVQITPLKCCLRLCPPGDAGRHELILKSVA